MYTIIPDLVIKVYECSASTLLIEMMSFEQDVDDKGSVL